MTDKTHLKGKKVCVVGLGRSGLAAAKLLSLIGAEVFITEKEDNSNIQENIKRLSYLRNIHMQVGCHTESFLKDSALLVVSPGVEKEAIPIIYSSRNNIPIISEIELGFLFSPAKIIAVTGTNGKTTVTTLIGNILQRQGCKTSVLGNIGRSFCEDVLELTDSDLVVLEVSTFQLEWIDKFRPYVSVILNISQNHLDRHKDIKEYIGLKKRIFSNQTRDDFTVLNGDDPVVKKFKKDTKAKVVYFKNSNNLNLNQAAAVAVASIFNIDLDSCMGVFKDFKGIEHRLEYVDNISGIDFINDSKSTTPEATLWALRNIKKPINLIAGGRNKGTDFSILRPFVKQHIKNIILIGESKDKMRSSLEGIVPIKIKDSLDDAVKLAFNLACQDECVLLSPMCASFDMFSNFQERGMVFKSIIKGLKQSNNIITK